jgi:hypothetical protein
MNTMFTVVLSKLTFERLFAENFGFFGFIIPIFILFIVCGIMFSISYTLAVIANKILS